MGKLSHIEDVEQRNEAGQAARKAAAPVNEPPASTKKQPSLETAEDEADFHGISSGESLGAGHTALIIIAIIIFAGVVFYLLNYWFHFI